MKDDEIIQNALDNLRKRLLDLTARNRLINLKHAKKSSIRVIDELPDQLAETILSGKGMQFIPVPEPTKEQLIQEGYIENDDETGQEIQLKKAPTSNEWARVLGFDTSYEMPIPELDDSTDKHNDHKIQTPYYPYELETRLRNLSQKARSTLEETGANILYISFYLFLD